MSDKLPKPKNRLIVALDNLTEPEAKKVIEEISDKCREYMDDISFKVNDLLGDIWLKWVAEMFRWVKWGIMLDPKWHDIPNTNANYIRKIAYRRLWDKANFVTMHASNWYKSLKEAVKVRDELGLKTKILAVSALTSLDDSDTNQIFDENAKHSVLKLAKSGLKAWIDWIVCSPLEVEALRNVFRDFDFEIIVPWIRFEWWGNQDHKRAMTPEEAISQWVTHAVMWRPILQSGNVGEAIARFFNEIKWVWYATDEQRYEYERLLYTGSWEELLKYIWAYYERVEWGKYLRLASWLISDVFINISVAEKKYLVLERAANEMSEEIRSIWIETDLIMWAQMWSIRISLYLAEKLWIDESIYSEKWWENDKDMMLKRHDMDLKWRKVILSEDITTKWTTLDKMIELVRERWWEVVAITCLWNRYWKESFKWIPLINCFTPPPFKLYYDDKTPKEVRWNHPRLPEGAEICEKPKNNWKELTMSMRK